MAIGAVTVRRRVESHGEVLSWAAELGPREPVRTDEGPASAGALGLGGDRVPCERVELVVADSEFGQLPDRGRRAGGFGRAVPSGWSGPVASPGGCAGEGPPGGGVRRGHGEPAPPGGDRPQQPAARRAVGDVERRRGRWSSLAPRPGRARSTSMSATPRRSRRNTTSRGTCPPGRPAPHAAGPSSRPRKPDLSPRAPPPDRCWPWLIYAVLVCDRRGPRRDHRQLGLRSHRPARRAAIGRHRRGNGRLAAIVTII